MSYSSNYTITTLSGNMEQYNTPNLSSRASFIPSGRLRQPLGGAPYTLFSGENKKYPFGELVSQKSLPVIKFTFEKNGGDGGPVYEDMGTGITGTLTSSVYMLYSESSGADRYAASVAQYDSGQYIGPLVGSYSMHFRGKPDGTGGSGSFIQFQNPYATRDPAGAGGAWKFLTGHWSLSMWFYPTWIGNHGHTNLFGLWQDPNCWSPVGTPNECGQAPGGYPNTGSWGIMLGRTTETSPQLASGPFALMAKDDGGGFGNAAPMKYSKYTSWDNSNDGTLSPAISMSAWNHLGFCVSGSEGDGDRFCVTYLNGQRLVPVITFDGNTAQYGSTNPSSSEGNFIWPATCSASPLQMVLIGPQNSRTGYGRQFSGSIDQVALWDYYLDQEMITKIYQSSGSEFNARSTFKHIP